MNWLPALSAWPFVAAGVAAALATLLLHLWRRRAVDAIAWGAMDFLREAVRQQRRWWQLRDALLLLLRTAAVLLFGLALARPYYSASGAARRERPVHAVLVIDNSLSMSYETLQGSLIQRAQQAARNLIERLPDGSRVSLLPGVDWNSHAAATVAMQPDQALAAVHEIEVVDGAANVRTMLLAAQEAIGRVGGLPAVVVLLGDAQASTFESPPNSREFDGLAAVQLVDLAGGSRDNTWVAEVDVPDEFAVAGTPVTINVTIERRGGEAPRTIDVACDVDGRTVTTRTMTLDAGSATQHLTFQPTFQLVDNSEANLSAVPVRISITPDRLPLDDVRYAAVTVLERLPAVFVDDVGEREDSRLGRWGETRSLRRLWQTEANSTAASSAALTAITLDQLDAESLAETRLLVVAGVADPQDKVPLLRSFVARGGRLLIAAGGAFDPASWTERAWLNGDGVLPAPLQPDLLGSPLSQATGRLNPLSIDFASLADNPAMRFSGMADDDLRDLYAEPLFFQVAQANADARLGDVLARFNDPAATPFAVERSIGAGKVVFLASGLTSDWNTLPRSNAVLLLDRLARSLIAETIAPTNWPAQADLAVPLPTNFRDADLVVRGPTPSQPAAELPTTSDSSLHVHFPALRRGIYELQRRPAHDTADAAAGGKLVCAVNGNASESDLTAAADQHWAALSRVVDFQVMTGGAELSFADAWDTGYELWWWLIVVVMLLLAAELVVLAAAHSRRPQVPEMRIGA